MYSYNNLRQPVNNMYARGMNNKMNNNMYNSGDRFFGGGFVAPLLLGGVAGYAIGNNRPNYYPYPYPYPVPVYYNNYYYPYY